MLIAALLVPATTWWAGTKYYNQQKEAESRQQLAKLQEIRDKHAHIVKDNERLAEAIQNEDKRRALFKGLAEGTTEFALEAKQRSPWKWPTDPDHVWQDQRRRAHETLVRLNATDLDQFKGASPPRRIPSR